MQLPRVPTRALTGLVLAVVVIAAATACKGPTPSQEAFYQPPTTLTGHPGDVIRSRSSVFTLDAVNFTPVAGVTSQQVLYRSTDALGAADAVSGTVLVPTAPWTGSGARPLISYAVGTRGLGADCAPSYTLTQGADYEGSAINAALQQGYAVAVSDYQGLGTPGPHTYMVGQSMGHAVLDMARAAERLPGTGLSASTPVGIWGYSEGGAAAGWAGEQAHAYAPDLNLKGVAEGGVPADLQAVAAGLDGGPFVSLALMTAIGYDRAYPELHLSTYLNAAGQTLLSQSQSVCLVSVDGFSTILNTAFHHISDYTSSNPLATTAWQARLGQNKLGSGKPTVPVFQYHALADEIVPFAQASTLHDTYCAKGVNETWEVLPLAEHALGLFEGQTDALAFLGARFAGTPTTGNC